MHHRYVSLALLLCGVLTVPACGRYAPVLDVHNAPVFQNHGRLTLPEVRDRIATGLAARKWGIVDEARGWMVARVDSRGHWAKIRITYDERSYTIIHFESSPALRFNGSKIHRNYNHWIRQLDATIRQQFTTPPPVEATAAPAPATVPETPAQPTEPAPPPPAAATAPTADPTAPTADPTLAPGESPAPDPSWNENPG